MKSDSSRHKSAPHCLIKTNWLLPTLIVALGVALSLVIFTTDRHLEEDRIVASFQDDAMRSFFLLQSNIDQNVDRVEGLASFFEASGTVSRGAFRTFVADSIARNSVLQAIEWIPRVTNSERRSYEEAARRDGFPKFRFTERGAGGEMVPAARRAEYYPVYFLEPYEGNQPALGFDLASNPARLAALKRARDTGKSVATEPIRLVQEPGHEQGFLIFHPIYRENASVNSINSRRANLLGFGLVVFRAGTLVELALSPLGSRGYDVYVFDASLSPETLLYRSNPAGAEPSPSDSGEVPPIRALAQGLHYSYTLEVGGRNWQVICRPLPGYLKTRRSAEPWVLLFAGLMITGVMTVYASARQRATSRIQHSEERYRSLVDISPDAIVFLNLDANLLFCNPQAVDLFGYDGEEELVGKNALMFLSPDDVSRAQEDMQRTIREGSTRDIEYTLVNRQGVRIPIEVSTSTLAGPDGSPIGLIGVIRDVSRRKRTEEAVNTEQALRTAIEGSILAGINAIGLDCRIIYANSAFCRMVGWTEEELLGKTPPFPYWASEEIENMESIVQMTMAGNIPPGGFETRFRRRNGDLFDVLILPSPLKNSSGELKGWLAAFNDITDRKQLEEQVRRAQKMEAVGRLAGGIAHDFNNLLMAINGFSEMACRRLEKGHPAYDQIQEIRHAGERAATLTRQLLAFSRVQVLQPKILDLNVVVSNMEHMLRRVIGEDLRLVTSSDPDLAMVKADPDRIEQVIMNLVVNARDAMPDGGTVTIATANVDLNEDLIRSLATIRAGCYVVLSVADTGCGMDEAVKSHLFEPFFTTKEQGKGTGLGLATVYGIVEQSNGHILVDSEIGKGSTFWIYLPKTKTKIQSQKTTDTGNIETAGGTETIMVVEDEELVRRLVREMLTAKGYAVLEAEDGKAALLLTKQYQGPIHLLLTDMVMPGMSGPELADHMVRLRPATKVLLMSGYMDSAIGYGVSLHGTVPFLEKPFPNNTLVKKVREVLDT